MTLDTGSRAKKGVLEQENGPDGKTTKVRGMSPKGRKDR